MPIRQHVTRARVIVGIAVLVVVAIVAVIMRPDPEEVDVGQVRTQPLETTIDADGYARVRDRFLVVAPVAGRLERLSLTEGARVRAGDIIARITPLPLDPAAVTQARARMDAASAMLVVATGQPRVAELARLQRQRELTRAKRLHDAGGIAPNVVEECEVALADAEEAVRGASQRARAAQADVRQAQALLAGDPNNTGTAAFVRAPATGRVLRIAERSERIVVAGTPILELGDPEAVEIIVDVLSSDVAAIQPGAPVRMTGWNVSAGESESATLSGVVRDIEPAAFSKLSALGVEERRVNVTVDVTDAPASLGDGFRVDARIIVWSRPNVLAVPSSALVRVPGSAQGASEWMVYTVRAGRVEQRAVRVGHRGSGATEILSGVEDGDSVVVFPSDRMRPGLRVSARAVHGR